MIIQQTTHIVFEYPQDYLQEQEWCKTKTDEWIHVGTDTRCSIYENKISYSIGQPNNSEKPNNSTISKMEQVEDEPQTCDNCKLKGSTKWCNNQVVCRAYKPMDEPQTEPLHTCSVNGRPYSECSSCEHFKCTADEPQAERSE